MAPVLFTQLYSNTVRGFPGCAYMAMGMAGVVSLILLCGFSEVDVPMEQRSGGSSGRSIHRSRSVPGEATAATGGGNREPLLDTNT